MSGRTLPATLTLCGEVRYLCVSSSRRRRGVVRPGDRQVVTAALSPQTLDIKRWFPT